MLEDTYQKIISSVAGAVILWILQKLWEYRKEKDGRFTGCWEDDIPEEDGYEARKDLLELKQNRAVVSGKISRFEPSDKIREWNCVGRNEGKDFFAIFWPVDKTEISYGCWYLHQNKGDCLTGFYLKFDEGEDGSNVRPVRVKLKKADQKRVDQIKSIIRGMRKNQA